MERPTLIEIPIFHTEQDGGSLGQELAQMVPQPKIKQPHNIIIGNFWENITDFVKYRLPADYSGLTVYQDGLPNIDEVIVAQIISTIQSPNYALLRWLQEQGAKVLGTESWQALQVEHILVQAILDAKKAFLEAKNKRAEKRSITNYENAARNYAQEKPNLLTERDNYIARRIEETLSRSGLLLIGTEHNVKRYTSKKIKIIEPKELVALRRTTLPRLFYYQPFSPDSHI